MSRRSPSPPDCERCSHPMSLAGRVPKVASHPELLTFRCDNCGQVETREDGDEE